MSTKRSKMNSDYAKVAARIGKTTGASKGRTVKPEVKVTPKGTSPLKKKVGVKVKVTW